MDPEQRDWDDLAESLMFALNTSYDHTRKETPFFLSAWLGSSKHAQCHDG